MLLQREPYFWCFISYCHIDKAFARKLLEALEVKGIRCWIDKQMNPGDDLHQEIRKAIRCSNKVLLCLSQHSLNSAWVAKEINIALDEEKRLREFNHVDPWKIIPLDTDGYLFEGNSTSRHSVMLRRRIVADFTSWQTDAAEFDSQVERVVKALRVPVS